MSLVSWSEPYEDDSAHLERRFGVPLHSSLLPLAADEREGGCRKDAGEEMRSVLRGRESERCGRDATARYEEAIIVDRLYSADCIRQIALDRKYTKDRK